MKSWLILVWLVTFAGDWLDGAEGDKQHSASEFSLQATGLDSTGEIQNITELAKELDEPHNKPDNEPAKELDKESSKEPAKGLDKESSKEPAKELDKESSKEPVKELDKESSKEPAKGLDKESSKEPAKKLDKESSKEPAKGLDKESSKEPAKELDKESVKEPVKELDKESSKEPVKELDKESSKEPAKKLDKESVKELAKGLDKKLSTKWTKGLDKEPAKELEKEPAKEPTAAPTTEATTAPITTPQRCPPSDPWGTCADDSKEESPRVATALTDFALKFYSKLAKVEGTGSNVVFSPFSVALALSHLLLGARGETKERLESILSYPSDLVCVHTPLQRLLKSQALISASKFFLRQGLPLNEAFLNQSLRFYNSQPQELSGNKTQDLKLINKWVRDVTKNKIKRLLKELEPDVQLVLLNAVYFQSKWKTTFKVKNTVNETFYRPGQAPIWVPMMTSKKYPLAFFNDPSLQAKVGRLQLSHNMSLIVIVPQHVSQMLAEVERKLTKETFTAVMKKLMDSPFKSTVVSLPKLKLDSSHNLMDILGEMDYGIFYDSNLCGISEAEDLLVTSAQQRAMLELNEEGLEAAAATAFSVARTAWVFDVQQPFFFMLWNDNHSFPMFMGHVNDPRV
ncbi:plasma protease C1 inhibitor isoform X2 [Natator depressus]|uniref:plasma protease C1 inhibitor isoform X2 n=1 Tax=Natator depressus TaxID=27790 RepID=UPI003EBD26F8